MDLERQVLERRGMEGLVLRYGFFYGPGSSYRRDGFQAEEVRKRRFPIVGGGDGTFSFIHVDDAAAATVAAVERGAPGIYNVIDDEPAPVREWMPVYAAAVGAKPPRRVPASRAARRRDARSPASPPACAAPRTPRPSASSPGSPRTPSWRQGFRSALG